MCWNNIKRKGTIFFLGLGKRLNFLLRGGEINEINVKYFPLTIHILKAILCPSVNKVFMCLFMTIFTK